MKEYLILLFFTISSVVPVNKNFLAQEVTYSAGYIYLDGSKKTKTEIENIRKKIINDYNHGINFITLAQKFNMDGNPHPEKFEFKEEEVVPEFSKAVKEHKPGEIFIVDVPSKKWYYVAVRNP